MTIYQIVERIVFTAGLTALIYQVLVFALCLCSEAAMEYVVRLRFNSIAINRLNFVTLANKCSKWAFCISAIMMVLHFVI